MCACAASCCEPFLPLLSGCAVREAARSTLFSSVIEPGISASPSSLSALEISACTGPSSCAASSASSSASTVSSVSWLLASTAAAAVGGWNSDSTFARFTVSRWVSFTSRTFARECATYETHRSGTLRLKSPF